MMQLGIYPSWQYSGDPAVNPKINNNVRYPDGVSQTTVQPLGPWYGGDQAGLGGQPVQLMGSGGIQLLGGKVMFFGPKPVSLLGLRGFGSITDTVSSIGTFLILGLAAFGGWNVYKRITK